MIRENSTNGLRQAVFDEAEYRGRLARVQAVMRGRRLDGLVCHNLSNVAYLTGFATIGSYGYGHYALVVPVDGDPALLASDFESHNAKLYSWLTDVVVYDVAKKGAGPVGLLAELVSKRVGPAARVGYEAGHYAMTIGEFETFRARLGRTELVAATDVVDRVKCVKTPAEVAVMRRAAALTSAGFRAATSAVRAGATDNDVASAAYNAIIGGGGEYFSLQPIVTTGRRSGIPHSTFARTPLAKGDVVFIELSASYGRYSAPGLRTAAIGEPCAEVRRAHDACLASVAGLIEGLRAGANGRDAAREAGRRLRAIEPSLVWHGYYGYSVGLTFPPMCSDCVSDCATITEHADLTLSAGMVFHCSTSLRKIGEFGVTVGETVLVTEQACEVLTDVPRELACLT